LRPALDSRDGLIGEDSLSEATRSGAVLRAHIDMVGARCESVGAASIVEAD
jgi:hypothetical protein